MKFIHCADIHLDSPLRGLDRYEGAPAETLRGATRRALDNLVDLALAEAVDFILMAGDLFDGDWPDFNTGLYFVKQMGRLREAAIPVYWLRGNHDAESRLTRRLPWPENVHELAANRPETRVDERCGVAIHGQGFATPRVSDDLVSAYPPPLPGYLNLGLLHTALEGREGHAPYAPTTVERLVDKGYDYWALGHVHQREVVKTTPWILFPGNLQGRHIRETGAKGATLVTQMADGVLQCRHSPLDRVRWALLDLPMAPVTHRDDLLDHLEQAMVPLICQAEGRLLAVRLRLVGASPLHAWLTAHPKQATADIQALALDRWGEGVWLERIQLQTVPEQDLTAWRERDDPVGELLREIERLKRGESEALRFLQQALLPELTPLRQKLPRELTEGEEDPLRLEDPLFLRHAVERAEKVLLSRLLALGEESL